jgi:ribosomal protein L17
MNRKLFDTLHHTNETTNGKLAEARATIELLLTWAWADAQHARENNALATARDDMRRHRALVKAYNLLCDCER